MTYQEQLTAMAERLARKDTGALYGADVIPQYMWLAAEALAFAAEQAEQAIMSFMGKSGYASDTDIEDKDYIINLMGLVPPNPTT